MDVTILCYYLEDTLLIGLGNLPLKGKGKSLPDYEKGIWKNSLESTFMSRQRLTGHSNKENVIVMVHLAVFPASRVPVRLDISSQTSQSDLTDVQFGHRCELDSDSCLSERTSSPWQHYCLLWLSYRAELLQGVWFATQVEMCTQLGKGILKKSDIPWTHGKVLQIK